MDCPSETYLMRAEGKPNRNQTAGKWEEEWEGKDRGATAVGSSEIVLRTDIWEKFKLNIQQTKTHAHCRRKQKWQGQTARGFLFTQLN